MPLLRVIHIYERDYFWRFPEKGTDAYFLNGWSGLIARYVERYFGGEFRQEVWRPESDVEKIEERWIDGILCKLIPMTGFEQKHYLSFIPLLKELRKVLSDGKATIMHHSSIHSRVLYSMLGTLGRVAIVAQNHGDLDPVSKRYLTGRRKHTLAAALERRLLPRLRKAWYLRRQEAEYLLRFLPEGRVKFLPVGVDFDVFKPADRKVARERIDLPKDAPVCLHVGRLDDRRGVRLVLDAVLDLRRAGKAPLLLLVGNSKDDKYYRVAEELGARIVPSVDHAEMRWYYAAANFLCSPGYCDSGFRGFDVSLMEALACGIPVISNMIEELPPEDWEKLGIVLKKGDNLGEKLEQMTSGERPYEECREVSDKYFSWVSITKRIASAYREIFEES